MQANNERALGITEELARFITATRYEDLPPEALGIAKRCLIDGLGVILAGTSEACSRILRESVLSLEGRKESTILGKGKAQAPARLAALVNGTAGHAMDWDDTALSTAPDRSVLIHPTLPPDDGGSGAGREARRVRTGSPHGLHHRL